MKSIASKFNLLTIFLIVLTVLITSSYIVWQHQINAFKNFARHGEEIAVILAKNIEYGVYTENQAAMKQALKALEGQPDKAYCIIYNKQQKPLLQRNYQKLSHLPALFSINNKTIINRSYQDSKNNKFYIDIVVPVYMQNQNSAEADLSHDFLNPVAISSAPELIGYLQLGISQAQIYHDSEQFMLQTLVVSPLVVLVGIFLTLWQTRRITLPIKKLVLAAHSISQGKFGEQLDLAAKDEIGDLANAFNGMSRELKNYQDEVLKQRETLEQQVLQRTEDLQKKTQEAYHLAEKAQAASKAKSEFLATMSHEIRTPMNGVLGMTELLLSSDLNSRQTRLAETAFRSAEVLLGVINNILDFSKIEAGKFQLSYRDFDLRSLVEETAQILAIQAHNKGLELILDLPCDWYGMVRADNERLRQILINLLSNAIKFTEQGEVQLKITRLNNSDTEQELLFSVTDSGIGIAGKHQQAIFESFTQADSTNTRRFGGTGLGLTISTQLVEMMGGKLELTSTVGTGSCFYFQLTLEQSQQTVVEPLDTTALQGLAVLVVDDNATNRNMLQRQLTDWGIYCEGVENGTEAIRALLSAAQMGRPYQIALLDWQMPEMDGAELVSIIRAEQPLIPPLSLVLLSSDSMLSKNKHQELGIDYFLTKPVVQKKLLRCLLELLNVRSGKLPGISTDTMEKELQKLTGHILLAEDNLINQKVCTTMLQAMGCQVDVADNGREAVLQFKNIAYDLIFMDCHMPEMDGFQAARLIRAAEQNVGSDKPIPIIALTADVQKGIIEECLNAGMDDYLSKPFSKKQLQEMLEIWLPQTEKLNSYASQNMQNQAVAMSATKITKYQLNQAALDNLRELTTENGDNLLAKAIELFFNCTEDNLAAMYQALTHQDTHTLTKIAHSFKSSCGNLGAQSLIDCAAAIEILAKNDQLQGIEALLNNMSHELPSVLSALNDELKSVPRKLT